ncbi:ATP-dependent RecD-like DNA helicase [Streptomyces sp. NPDC102360]|uniref:SF1B family DNA helicase RecD2 n=1 Tax=Streptomyces sp. NPDC102360 TaxID=3366160 RepID=UPI0037F14665
MTDPVPLPLDAPDLVEGVVDHVLHVSYDERTVLRLTSALEEDSAESVTAFGTALFGVQPGESLRLTGSWRHHPRYGRQFRTVRCERTLPAGARAIRLYLASGMIRGIGPVLAGAIVDAFAEQTLKVLEAEPERLREVYGIGEMRLDRIKAAWREQRAIAEIMVFLQGLGITPALAVKIYTTYADTDDDPMHIVRRTPYRLCRDVHGIGFRNADTIALAVGIPKHSDARIQAALVHELDQAGASGHCHLPVRVLLARTRHLLSDDDPATAEIIDDAVLRHAINALRAQDELVTEPLPVPVLDGTDACADTEIAMLPHRHRDETQLAFHVRRLLASMSRLAELAPWSERLTALRGSETAGLTDEQHQAIRTALTRPLSVLTGGPGCGKTHTLRTLVELADEAGAVIALAAPTGKAAKRLEETCGQAATTVHRLIRPPEGDSLFDHASILETADLVVVDEASMLDLALARRLAAAIPDGCHLLLVGDINQLPSVGPGRVLRDLLDVDAVPRTRLTQVFRQHDDSAAIVNNAHRILHGGLPQDDPKAFWNRPMATAEEIAERVVDLVCDLMPRHFTEVRPEDIQVLCPGKKNTAGMTDLNLRLQERLNPPADDKPQHYHAGIAYRLGDRVQQIRNNPHRGANGVFNGTSGTVTALDPEAHQLTVTFTDGETAAYPFPDLDELVHAYALTVHRSQGSEYPYVIVPMISAAGMLLLQRNLLYTAVTRARDGVLLIGQTEAVERAIANNRTQHRNTALTHRITHETPIVPAPRAKAPVGQLAWE